MPVDFRLQQAEGALGLQATRPHLVADAQMPDQLEGELQDAARDEAGVQHPFAQVTHALQAMNLDHIVLVVHLAEQLRGRYVQLGVDADHVVQGQHGVVRVPGRERHLQVVQRDRESRRDRVPVLDHELAVHTAGQRRRPVPGSTWATRCDGPDAGIAQLDQTVPLGEQEDIGAEDVVATAAQRQRPIAFAFDALGREQAGQDGERRQVWVRHRPQRLRDQAELVTAAQRCRMELRHRQRQDRLQQLQQALEQLGEVDVHPIRVQNRRQLDLWEVDLMRGEAIVRGRGRQHLAQAMTIAA